LKCKVCGSGDLRARWYDSATGRFTTRDPFPGFAVLPQTLHLYVYANNNPVNLTDPSGEIPIETLLDIVVFAVDIGIYVWDALNPALDHCTRMSLLGIDLAALGVDGLALVIPYLPGGGGLAGRLAGRGLLVFAQGGARASAGLRIIQIGAKAAQSSAYLARTGGRGGGTRGVVGGGGSNRMVGHHTIPREILEKYLSPDIADAVRGKKGAPNIWDIPENIHKQIHSGPGGGRYNQRWIEELQKLRKTTPEAVLEIRDRLVREFNLEKWRPR
jgi:RHS repeat-associated protein